MEMAVSASTVRAVAGEFIRRRVSRKMEERRGFWVRMCSLVDGVKGWKAGVISVRMAECREGEQRM